MKPWLIRLQIAFILLIFASPFLYFTWQKIQPSTALIQYDRAEKEKFENGTYPSPPPWLSTQGKHIVNPEGKPVLLRGVNIAGVDWGEGYATWNSIAVEKAVNDWGANIIRTRVIQSEFEKDKTQFFLNLERQILEPARKSGVYVILHPWLGENQSLPNQGSIDMWSAIAKRYRNNPAILYDLLAEPRDVTHEQVRAAYEDLIPKIRKIHPRSLIFVTGTDWGREINTYADNPLPYDNIVYRSNPYNKTGELEGMFAKVAQKYPVFLGEFGTDEELTMDLEAVESLIGLAQNLNVGWTAWHFSANGCPCLLSDEQNFTPTEYGQMVKQALAGVTPPYPTPSFDPNPNRFYIYSEFLENGYTDYSWNIQRNLVSNQSAHSGSKSLQIGFYNGGGVFLKSSRPIKTSEYKSLHLAMNISDPSFFTIRFNSLEDSQSTPLQLINYAQKDSSNWFLIDIPTSEINLSNIASLMIEAKQIVEEPLTFYLDDIYFTR